MALKTMPFDVAEYLDTPQEQAEYLAAAFETGDALYIRKALGTVGRARGMTALAKDADVSRQSLYKSLGDDGDPKFSTVLSIVKALGLQVTVHRPEPMA